MLRIDSLQITQGEFVSVVGPSGCGKSTLLRIIAGLLSPSSGTIEYSGSDGDSRPRTGFVFQEATLLPWRTAETNIRLPGELERSSVSIKQIRRLAELVGLSPTDLRKRPAALSGGMKMRVSLARALAMEPAVLLLDEPFASLDDLLRQQLQADVVRIQKELKLTTILVTHNVPEAVFMSDRVLVLGGTPATVVSDARIPLDGRSGDSVRTTPQFAECVQQIMSALYSPVAEAVS